MTGTVQGGSPVETDRDYGPPGDPRAFVRKWQAELDFSAQAFHRWEERAKAVDKRYKDERESQAMGDGPKKFNALWANFQVAFPAHWSRIPEPVVARRHDDDDAVARVATMVLERCLEAGMQDDRFGQAMEGVVQDRLLVSRGTSWIRYVPTMRTVQPPCVECQPAPWEPSAADAQPDPDAPPQNFVLPDGTMVDGEAVEVSDDQKYLYSPPPYEEVAFDEVVDDYVNWRDFRHTAGRRWSEVWWVSRRVHMTKDEVAARFDNPGVLARMKRDPIAGKIPYNFDAAKAVGRKSDTAGGTDPYKKAEIWEIWDIHAREALWLATGYGENALDRLPDPLKLKGFFPCPRPCWGTMGTDSLEPVPDYYEYQDQATQLDELTNRISLLAEAVAVRGAYNNQHPAVSRLLGGMAENRLVPVDNWALFAEQGGIPGLISWLPIDTVVAALKTLVEQRAVIKADLWEISGYSDIVRGQTDPDETYGAQQLKGKFATLRLSRSQMDVQRFARDQIRLKAEIMCLHLQPATLWTMSGADMMAAEDPDVATYFDQAIQLLRDNRLRSWRIDIETDSTIALDEESERAGLAMYLKAIAQVLPQMLQLVQQAPEMAEWAAETLKHMARKFRAGRAVEGALDRALKALAAKIAQGPPAPPPDAKLIEANASQMNAQSKADDVASKVTERTKSLQIKEFATVAQAQNDMGDAQLDKARAAFDIAHSEAGPNLAHEAMRPKPAPVPGTVLQ